MRTPCGQCRRALIVAADEISLTSKAVETLRLTSRPQQHEGACALVLSADPAENRLGQIELSDDADGSERLLPCGVPAGLSAQLSAADPKKTVRLARLTASQWKEV